jgi:hypothetical protein
MAMDAKAPTLRNRDAIQLWFDAWNADNERARDAYDQLRDEQERPRQCRAGLHWLLAGNVSTNGSCLQCRNIKARAARGRPRRFRNKRIRLTPELAAEICRRYQAGESIETVRRAVGCGPDLVVQALDRNDVPTRTLAEAAVLRWKRAA